MIISMRSLVWRVAITTLLLSQQISAISWIQTSDPVFTGSLDPQIAVDLAGNAVAVWERFDPAIADFFIIQAATLPVGTTIWSNPVTLSNPLLTSREAQVRVDSVGNAIAVWETETSLTTFDIRAATFNFGTGVWSTEVIISTSAQNESPQIAVDPSGNAVVVWHNITADSIEATTYDFTSNTWDPTPTTLSTGTGNSVPQVGVASNGDAIAIWQATSGADFIIAGSFYDSSADTWTATTTLASIGENNTIPQIGVDPAGNSVIVWENNNPPSDPIIQGATLAAGSTTWTVTGDVSPVQDSHIPQVAVDANGNAIAIWRNDLGSSTIQAARLPFGSTTWQSTTTLNIDPTRTVNQPAVAIDNAGNAFGIWVETLLNVSATEAAFLPAGSLTWESPNQLAPDEPYVATPQIATSGLGYTVAIWQISPAGSNGPLQAAINSTFLNAINIQVTSCTIAFATQIEFFNHITWQAPLLATPLAYQIYRNAVLIGTVAGNSLILQFDDHNRKKNKTYVYDVISVI